MPISQAAESAIGQAVPYRLTAVLCTLTCALAPAYTIRWHLGFYPTTLLEDAILVCLVVFVIEYLRRREPLNWGGPFLIPGLLFLLAGAIAVVTAPGLTAALGLYRAYLLEPVAFAVVLVNVIRTPSRAFLLVSGLFLGAAGAGLANSVVVAWAIANHTYLVTQTPPVVIYLTANAVALFVVPLVAVAGSLALHAGGVARVCGAAFVLAGVVITFLSFSRGGYLALAAVVVGLALSHRRRLLLLGLSVLAAGGLGLVSPIRTRVLIETQNVYGNTISSRIDLWTATAHLLQQRPLFGAGLAGFPQRITPYFTHIHTPASFIDPHNIVLNFWVETGLPGLIAMAWILGVGLVVCWRGWRAGGAEWRPYHFGVLLALVAVIVHGQVDVPYFKNDLSLEFWALVAIGYAGRLWTPTGDPLAIVRGSRSAELQRVV
jgi:O-antigen ligase